MRDETAGIFTEWELELRGRRRAAGTIRNYRDTVAMFDGWLPATTPITEATRRDVATWIGERLDLEAPQTALSRFRRLRAFYRWAVSTDPPIIEKNPMQGLREPSTPEAPPPVLTDDEIRALFASIKGSTFIEKRDRAILALLVDSGCRVGELVGMEVEDLNVVEGIAEVTGKGSKTRVIAFGVGTGQALQVYLRLRRTQRDAGVRQLWIGARGPITVQTVWKICRTRGEDAGIKGMFPHQLRHTFAHKFRADGGSEGDLAALGGWKSAAMLRRYGKSAESERAVATHKRLGMLDNLL